MSNQKLKNIVEGFIFASDKTLNVDHIIKLFPEGEQPTKDEINTILQLIEADYENRGIELKKVSSGYRFQVREEISPWVSRLWEEKPQKYTRALLETLALIVYRQPITRGEIEEIRGVSVSSNIIKTLQERDWVKVVGHKDVPGRPALLASTKQFLDYFNLKSLEDLPPLSEIKDLDAIATELDPEQNAALISAIREMQEAQNEPDGNAEAVAEQDQKVEESDEQESEHAESPEHIAAELDAVLAQETNIEAVEQSIESALLEQTESKNDDVEIESVEREESSTEESNELPNDETDGKVSEV